MEKLLAAIAKAGGQTKFAFLLGISQNVLANWILRNSVPIERCVPIERATGCQVMRWDLRPEDWWQIWPELMCHPNAPEVPTSSVSSGSVDGLVPSPQGLGSFSAEVQRG